MLVPGVTVVSLQMNVPVSDQPTLRNAADVLDLSQDQENLADTAAVISQLDLLISIETSVAHLAGAMGKPVWILLAASADWRWLLDREDSPWYPSARLFRQDKAGDWTGVASRVRDALRGLIVSP
jgi:ADP-heptose:LPS heptosyltransferase